MSIEISILSDVQLSSIAEWQEAIDAEGFPLRLSGDEPLDKRGGSLIAHLPDKSTSVEYRVEDFNQLKDVYKDVQFGHVWKHVLALPWIHGFDGLTAAWMAATAYACATGGIVFDPQEARTFSPEEAIRLIQDIERTRPEAEAALRTFMRARLGQFTET